MLSLLKFNRHWENGYTYPFSITRSIFPRLISQIEQRQIAELCGLRRTGKTTLLMQVMNELLSRGVDPLKIWYFTFDEQTADLDFIFNEFQKQTGLSYKNEKLFVFLDEIQKLQNFQSQLKIYYDLYPDIKFFISGSTSLFIRRKIQESLAGRINTLFLKPLQFSEYLLFAEKAHWLERPSLYQTELENEFELYWDCQFIEAIPMKDAQSRKEYVLSIVKKIIFEDIPQLYAIDHPQILLALLQMIAAQPGMYLHYENIANDLKISQKTIVKYLAILEQAFLIKTLFNFTGNMITSQKKMKRVYLTSTSFSSALTIQSDPGKTAENVFITLNDVDFFWRDVYKHEIDFIRHQNNKPLPVEIKYKPALAKRDLQNIRLFTKKYKPQQAIILMKRWDKETIMLDGTALHLKSIYLE